MDHNEWISNSGELEAIMDGIEDEYDYANQPHFEIAFDEDGNEVGLEYDDDGNITVVELVD